MNLRSLIALTTATAAVALTLTTAPTSADPGSTSGPPGTSEFRGVNWADPRDNYASDPVVPSGLDTSDTYAATYRKSSGILLEFRRELRANTVRLPINPSSVGTDWWQSYRGAIDSATRHGFKVILGYWESPEAKDGRADDPAAFDQMWDTVVAAYAKNPRVYFEPMNEPFGYSLEEWVDLTSSWLQRHSDVPRSRVVISGTGYNDDVTGVGAAPELDGTLLSLHFYGFWDDATTEAEWKANLEPRIGPYGWRTIVDEAGAPMTTGLNYGNHEGDTSTAYLGALTETARSQDMGIVYWPGLRDGDAYTLTERVGPGDLAVTNESGLAQLQWGWGLLKEEQLNDDPPAPPGSELVGVASGRCVDVPGFSTTPGTQLDLWDCNGGGNQLWNLTGDGELRIYGDMCMAVGGDGSAGSPAVVVDCGTEPAREKWTYHDDGSITSKADPDLCLDAAGAGTGNGTPLDVWHCNGQDNQRFSFS